MVRLLLGNNNNNSDHDPDGRSSVSEQDESIPIAARTAPTSPGPLLASVNPGAVVPCALGPLELPCPKQGNEFLHLTLAPSKWYENATEKRRRGLACFALPPWIEQSEASTTCDAEPGLQADEGEGDNNNLALATNLTHKNKKRHNQDEQKCSHQNQQNRRIMPEVVEEIFEVSLQIQSAGYASVADLFGQCESHPMVHLARQLADGVRAASRTR
ncbi:unnamed protein product [Amoebophrya sp. A25]|nr:unnamed protein product [Amoebophrya sp. A25]|eukprot:GSA25T00010789001.1